MANPNCPTMRHILAGDVCTENFAGLGSVAYFFLKDEMNLEEFKAEKNVYAWTDDVFKEGKGFYKVELKPESQSFTGESQGKNKGFNITGQLIIEVVNEEISEFLRSLNNLDWGCILPDGDDKFQLMYNKTRKVQLDSGSLKTETGAASSDDRQTTLAPVCPGCKYPNLYVTFPEGTTPEDYLATANSSGGHGGVSTTDPDDSKNPMPMG